MRCPYCGHEHLKFTQYCPITGKKIERDFKSREMTLLQRSGALFLISLGIALLLIGIGIRFSFTRGLETAITVVVDTQLVQSTETSLTFIPVDTLGHTVIPTNTSLPANPIGCPVKWVKKVLDSSGDSGGYNSLAISDDGTLLLAYFEDKQEDIVYLEYRNGNWKLQPLKNTIGERPGYFISQAVRQTGEPGLAFFVWDTRKYVYAERINGRWQFAELAAIRAQPEDSLKQGSISLAYDSIGQPHLAFYHHDQTDVIYAYRQENEWKLETVSNASPRGGTISLAVGPNMVPCIAFREDGLQIGRASCRERV